MAAGEAVDPLPPPKVGTMFVRISLDQVTDMADFEQLATSGEINRGARDDDGRSDR
jgi:hypothetical protein